MSLIDNIINKTYLDNALRAELSDMAYKATGGVPQPRARASIVNPGLIHFAEPTDKIIKEMILDYQKEQANTPVIDEHGDTMAYYPSIYKFDATNFQQFVPINIGRIGREAREDDIIKLDIDISKDADNYNITEENINYYTKKLNEYKQKILENDEKLRETVNRMKEFNDDFKKLDPSYLTKLNNELSSKKSKLASAKRERVKEEIKKEINDIQYEIDSFNKKHAELTQNITDATNHKK